VLVPRVTPGTKEGTRESAGSYVANLQKSVAAPATVSGEPASTRPLGNREGRAQLSDDPRARRPASTVTQPVDGESIRSGLSQR
jgi:hypothetical protein